MALAHFNKESTEKVKQEWLIENLLPKGILTLLAGETGVGKSSLMAYLATRLPKSCTIWFWLLEDDVQVYNNKIGVNDNIKYVNYVDKNGDFESPTIQDLKRDITKYGIDLFVIDPIAFMMGGKDINDASKVRALLMPLKQLAQDTGCCILGVHHFSKGAGRAKDRITGSHAWTATARHVLTLAEDTNKNVFLEVTNSNIGPTGISWQVIREVDEYCMRVSYLVDAEEGSVQGAINSIYDKQTKKGTPVIENLKDQFPIFKGFSSEDIKAAGNLKSFYNWIEKNPDKIQSRQEGRKKIYWFV